jgi:hypothetical protein
MIKFGLRRKGQQMNYTGKKSDIHVLAVFFMGFYSHFKGERRLFLSLFYFFFIALYPVVINR